MSTKPTDEIRDLKLKCTFFDFEIFVSSYSSFRSVSDFAVEIFLCRLGCGICLNIEKLQNPCGTFCIKNFMQHVTNKLYSKVLLSSSFFFVLVQVHLLLSRPW